MKFSEPKIWKPNDDIWGTISSKECEKLPTLSSIFNADLLCVKSGELIQRAIAPNVVLNQAYIKILNGAHPRFSYATIVVGRNGSEPLASQTGLLEVVSGGTANGRVIGGPYTSSSQDVAYSSGYSWSYSAYWPSQYANDSLREVGLLSDGTSYGYLNRAIFKDTSGNAITIPKESSQVLRITVVVRFTYTR